MKMKLKKAHVIVILGFIAILSVLLALYLSPKGLNISDIKKLARKTAKADLKAGKASILVYGYGNHYKLFHSQTGLKERYIAGCVVNPEIQEFAQAYNSYIYEHIDKFGFPKNSKHMFKSIILNPVAYMKDTSTGNLIELKENTTTSRADKKYSLFFNSKNKLIIKHNGNEIPVLSYIITNKNPKLKIKWGPIASNIFFIQLKTKIPNRKRSVYSMSYYVIDLSDGKCLNVLYQSQ